MAAEPLKYPVTQKIDHSDNYHGVTVPDPYRWLEDDVRTSDKVREWVTAQNEVTSAYLESLPAREAIEQRLTKLWNYEKFSTPFRRGDRYYFYKNDGLQNQSVLYMQESLDSPASILIDPNTWSKDGTVALAGLSFSEDGKYLAYGIQDGGSDWRTWRVMEIATKNVLDDELKWVKFSGATWTPDGNGFFYGRYKAPTAGATFQQLNLNQQIYYHRVGTPQSADVLAYHRPDHPEWGFGTDVTDDGKYLVITVWKGTDNRYRVLYRDLSEPYSIPVDLIDSFDNEYSLVGSDGSRFYFLTDLHAPRKRVIAVDINDPFEAPPEREEAAANEAEPEEVPAETPRVLKYTEIIPQAEETLTDVSFVNNLFIASYLKDAKSAVQIFRMDGRHVRDVEFPGIGKASGFGGRRGHTETFYSFSSFATPPSIYRYDMITGESRLFRRAGIDVDPAEYEVKQVFFKSTDGTRVPMFIAHKRGIELDGNNPTLLYGYGGFSISLTPGFSISRLAWMDMGGVFAMANLRGGGEYGEDWHKAGTKLNKQNVFNDFISAAEWLIENKYTSKKKIAIQGGSNGGLLVGACMAQRPDLYGACLPAVGVMDMLRFHKFTAGRFWVDDYGSADTADEFAALYKYSPYHNLKDGVAYPPTLITTADTDDRVVPGHSFKFAARLQAAHQGDAPVLIRIETRAGHGSGKPTSKIIEEIADQWAFLAKNLDMTLPAEFQLKP